jgi:hypothetical protein
MMIMKTINSRNNFKIMNKIIIRHFRTTYTHNLNKPNKRSNSNI